MRTRSTLKSQASGNSRDYEAMDDWHSAVRRVIDIEGISSDSYAYTITICGPAPRNKSMLLRFGLKKDNKRFNLDKNPDPGHADLQISHKTEVTVERAVRHSRVLDPSESKLDTSHTDCIELCITPNVDGASRGRNDDLDLIDHSDVGPYPGRQTFYDATHSDESIEALPRMPLPTSQPQGRRTPRLQLLLRRPMSRGT